MVMIPMTQGEAWFGRILYKIYGTSLFNLCSTEHNYHKVLHI